MRHLILFVLAAASIACPEDKPALTKERVEELFQEKHAWYWCDTPLETVAADLTKETGIPIRISDKLATSSAEGKAPLVTMKAEVTLGTILELISNMTDFSWILEGTEIVFETIEEGDARVAVRYFDVRQYLPSARSAPEVAAMKPADRKAYDAAILKETRELADVVKQSLIEVGIYDEATTKVLLQPGRLEIRGNRKLLKRAENLVDVMGRTLKDAAK